MNLYPKASLLGVLVAFTPAVASAFVTTFPPVQYPLGSEVAGSNGWTINDSGDGGAGYLSFVTTLNTSAAAALGGWYNIPAAAAPTTVYLSQSTPGELQFVNFATTFAISPSTEFNQGRDGFGFSLRDSDDANLLTISLVPAASPSTKYQVYYTVGAEASQAAKNGLDDMFIEVSGLYTLDLAFTPNGANPTFSGSVVGSNTQTFTGTATGLGSAALATFGAEWNVLPQNWVGDPAENLGGLGDNFLVFDNVSLIPEPSTALLAGLASLGLLRRRRN